MVLDLTPLNQHPDDGFGALARSFERAADHLETPHASSLRNAHLPVAFLRRHASELYLKSLLIMLHEGLQIPYGGTGPPFDRRIWANQRWQSLYNTHEIGVLFRNLAELLPIAQSLLRENPSIDLTLPAESEAWAATIDANDPHSTLFRYPTTRDAAKDQEKDSMKEVALQDLFAEIKNPSGRKIFNVATTRDGEVKQVLGHDPSPLASTLDALRSLTAALGALQRRIIRQLFGAT